MRLVPSTDLAIDYASDHVVAAMTEPRTFMSSGHVHSLKHIGLGVDKELWLAQKKLATPRVDQNSNMFNPKCQVACLVSHVKTILLPVRSGVVQPLNACVE